MPMGNEPERMGQPIVTSREPVGPKRGGDKGSAGDQAVMDAVIIIGLCWLFVFMVMFSLRRYNV